MNKLVDGNNNVYHCFVSKKPIDADYFALTEKIESKLKAPNFGVGDRVRVTKYKNIFSKGYIKIWSKKIL